MTEAEYQRLIEAWCAEVQEEAVRLFKSGTMAAETTGLAINIVESRRKQKAAQIARFQPPGPMRTPGH